MCVLGSYSVYFHVREYFVCWFGVSVLSFMLWCVCMCMLLHTFESVCVHQLMSVCVRMYIHVWNTGLSVNLIAGMTTKSLHYTQHPPPPLSCVLHLKSITANPG